MMEGKIRYEVNSNSLRFLCELLCVSSVSDCLCDVTVNFLIYSVCMCVCVCERECVCNSSQLTAENFCRRQN